MTVSLLSFDIGGVTSQSLLNNMADFLRESLEVGAPRQHAPHGVFPLQSPTMSSAELASAAISISHGCVIRQFRSASRSGARRDPHR